MSEPKASKMPKPETVPADSSATKAVAAVEKGFKVVALKPGVYKQCRKETGDAFLVEKEEQLASWMKCEDPEAQKKHKANMDARKASYKNLAAKTVAGT